MTYEKIVTLYDTADHAEAARRNLVTAGFPPSDISTINSKTLGLTSEKLREPGLWHRLFGREIQQYEATLYGHSVDSGGVILTVRLPESEAARATTILNAHQAVDLLKRAEQQGLISASATKPVTVPLPTAQTTAVPTEPMARPATLAATTTVPGEEILALAQEEINVGKRLVQEGTTRIRRFIIETPVEAQVTLHEEHARVIRRAIADPNYLRNIDWTDKTIEITETAEEPVVTKSVHVAEEIVIQREGADHVKTVRDKVRRQQIEVERLAGMEPVVKKS
jgi:stress response protein YsnF